MVKVALGAQRRKKKAKCEVYEEWCDRSSERAIHLLTAIALSLCTLVNGIEMESAGDWDAASKVHQPVYRDAQSCWGKVVRCITVMLAHRTHACFWYISYQRPNWAVVSLVRIEFLQ